jgi:hypothetical protein
MAQVLSVTFEADGVNLQAAIGLGRIVALNHRASTLYQMH